MKKNIKLNCKKILNILIILVFLFPAISYAINTVETGYMIAPGESKEIDAHGVCRKVNNQSDDPIFDSKTFFIPTKTVLEWDSFINNHPEEVTISPCAVTVVTPVPTSSSGPDIYYHYYRGDEAGNFWE